MHRWPIKFWPTGIKLTKTQLHVKRHLSSSKYQSKYMYHYYMASSASGQDELNPALWLATWAELSCLLEITHHVPPKFPRKPYWIINALLTKLVWSRWLDIGLALFFEQKKKLGQYPTIFTSHLVNNPYILPAQDHPLCLIRKCSLSIFKTKSCLTKLVAWKWLDIGLVLFFHVCGPWICLGP